MTGVEILTTNEVVTASVFNIEVFIIASTIVFLIFIFAGFISCCIDGYWDGMLEVFVAGIIFGALMGLMSGLGFSKPTGYEIQYKATISGDVSMGEFTSKYEIIEQDGEIYTIKEKE